MPGCHATYAVGLNIINNNKQSNNLFSACPMQAIGVASKDAFPDNRFSASSGGNIASKGRLNGAGAWSPSNNSDADDYLQIDLLYEFVICAVATQGNPNDDHWTTKYKLQLALMDNDWIPYQEDGIIKVGMIRRENIILCTTH